MNTEKDIVKEEYSYFLLLKHAIMLFFANKSSSKLIQVRKIKSSA